MKIAIFITLSCVFALTAFSQTSQPQFSGCNGVGFELINNQTPTNSPSSLYSVAADGSLSLIAATGANNLNGMGADNRPDKKYIWAMSGTAPSGIPSTSPAQLYRIGSDGSAQLWSTINPPSSPLASGVLSFAGDINPTTGVYYIPAATIDTYNPITHAITYSFYLGTINVDAATYGGSVTPTYTKVTIDATSKPYFDAYAAALVAYALDNTQPQPSGLMQDIALSPDGTKLVSFFGIENALFTLDLTTMTTLSVPGPSSNATNGYTGQTGATTDEMGGIFFAEDGTMYAVQTDTGKMFTVNASTGELTLLSGSGSVDQRGDATICPYNINLPVVFQNINATISDNHLKVKWTTTFESNTANFAIEASPDGKNFKEVEKIQSKAETGNSAILLNYECDVPVNNIAGLFQILLLPIIGAFAIKRRKNYLLFILTIAVVIFGFIACNKSDSKGVSSENKTIYVRVKQVDNNNNFMYSKIIKAINN
jgi:hypothetical protein